MGEKIIIPWECDLSDDIIIYKKILKSGRNFMIIVPKELVDTGILEAEKMYKITLEKLPESDAAKPP